MLACDALLHMAATASQFIAPKLARAHACLEKDPNSPLWPPSLPPPFESCAPHLDHGLYHPQLVRWLQFFHPSQLLIVSFSGFISQPSEVFHDVLIHAGLPRTEAKGAVERLQQAPTTAHRKKMEKCAPCMWHAAQVLWCFP